MKIKLLFLLLMLLAKVCWGQEKENRLTDLEQKYLDEDCKNGSDCKDCEKCKSIKGRVNRGAIPENSNTYVIDFDFQDGVYRRNLPKLKINTPVVFRISNINRLAYDVVITSKDSALAVSVGLTDMEEANKKIQATAAEKTTQEIVNKTPGLLDIKQGEVSNNVLSENFNSLKKLSDELNELNENYIVLKIKEAYYANQKSVKNKELEQKKESPDAEHESQTSDKDTIKIEKEISKIDSLQEVITENLAETEIKINDINQNIQKLTNENTRAYIDFQNKLAEFNKFYDQYFLERKLVLDTLYTCQQPLLLAINDPYLNYKKFTDLKKSYGYEKIKSSLLSLQKFVSSLDNTYLQVYNSYILLKNVDFNSFLKPEAISKLITAMEIRYTYIQSVKAEADIQNLESVVGALLHSLELLSDKENYNIESSPVQPTQDLAEFSVEIHHKNTNEKVNNSKEFKYREFTYGGIRLDAGIGFSLTYLNNTPQYTLVDKGNGTHQIAIDKKHFYCSSLLLLFTATYRSTGYVSFGGSAGIGVSAGDDSTLEFNNYFLGLTAMFGKSNRFAVTGGMAIKQVEKLKPGYEVNSLLGSPDIDYTSDTFRFGPFISITYNLTSGIRDQVGFLKSLF